MKDKGIVNMLGMVEGDQLHGTPARRWSNDITDWCSCILSQAVKLPLAWRRITGLSSWPSCTV